MEVKAETMTLYQICILVFPLILIVFSVITDRLTDKIYNSVVISGAMVGIFVSFVFKGFIGLGLSLLTMVAIIGMLFILFALRFLGAGDVKLFAAIGTFLGFKATLSVVLFSFLAGGILGVVFLMMRKNTMERFKNLITYIKACILGKKLLQYEYGSKKDATFRFSYAILGGFLCKLWI